MALDSVINVALSGFAGILDRSALLRAAFLHTTFRGKGLIVGRMRGCALPQDVVVERQGIRYRLLLSDQLQRCICFNAYDSAGSLEIAMRYVSPGSVCLDVGANVGYFSLHLARRVGPTGQVHAFEADPRNYARLDENGRLNEFGSAFHAHLKAVTNHTGPVNFYQSAADQSGWGSLTAFSDIAVSKVEVPATTLDQFLGESGIARVDFMKVDIEAHEFELLEGARESLAKQVFRCIMIEFNGVRLAERGRTLAEMLDLFADYGYQAAEINLHLLRKIRLGKIDPTRIVMDLMFVPAGV